MSKENVIYWCELSKCCWKSSADEHAAARFSKPSIGKQCIIINAQKKKKNKEERKQKHTCRGIPVDRMDKYILFISIKFKRFSIVAPSNTFKCTHCLKYFMFNYLALMPSCSEGNLYKSQVRQLIKLADQDIEDNHPHLVTTHLIQIKPVF